MDMLQQNVAGSTSQHVHCTATIEHECSRVGTCCCTAHMLLFTMGYAICHALQQLLLLLSGANKKTLDLFRVTISNLPIAASTSTKLYKISRQFVSV